jgi:hypothetical protein
MYSQGICILYDILCNKKNKKLTLKDVTNMVIDRRRKIVPPRAKNRRSMILLDNKNIEKK